MSRFAGLKKNAAPEAPVKLSINDEVAASPSANRRPPPTGPKPKGRQKGRCRRAPSSKEISGLLHPQRSDNQASIEGLPAKRSMI